MNAVEAVGLGKRYGRRIALQDCDLSIPEGRVVGLVGPNGAGKTTLLHLALGLISPTQGLLRVLGESPTAPGHLARVGFVAQDTPTYPTLTVADHLRMGQELNPRWDAHLARRRIDDVGLDPKQPAGRLSGGQRAQLALTLAVAKCPELLILDEPVASLDPLARREFAQSLMEVVAERGTTVVLSSHLLADLERLCDYFVVMVASKVQLSGPTDELLETHFRLIGARRDRYTLPDGQELIEAKHGPRQSTLLVRSQQPILDPTWLVEPIGMEDLMLAYMGRSPATAGARSLQSVTP